MRRMRRVDVADALAATEVDSLAIGENRGGRSAMSFSETITPVWQCATWASGATASQSFIAPHSSAS